VARVQRGCASRRFARAYTTALTRMRAHPQVTSALEGAVAASDVPCDPASAATALSCLRLLARVVPFVVGDARLGRGAPEEHAAADGAADDAGAAADAADADAALAELCAHLAGGPLPEPRCDEWRGALESADAVEAAREVLNAEAEAETDAAELAAAAAHATALLRSRYTAPPPSYDSVTAFADVPLSPGEGSGSAARPADAPPAPLAAVPAPPPAAPKAPLGHRIAAAVAAAALCPGLTLPARAAGSLSAAWAPPLAPGAASEPPDAELAGARCEALRAICTLAAAEALYVPFAPVAAAQPGAAAPPAPAAHHAEGVAFLAAFSGRGSAGDGSAAAVAPAMLRRLVSSLLNGAASAPGLLSASPEGAALVRASMRALLLLVCVAEEDVPLAAAPPATHALDAPALFADMTLPQAASLHASIAALLASCAASAVATAEWADVITDVAVASAGDAAGVTPRAPPPPGASEAVALALAALERAPAFADVAAGRAGAGGWHLAAPVLTLMLVLRDDPSAAGLLRAGSFLLLNLGSRRAFGVALNEPLRGTDAPLASAARLGPPLPPGATRGDALLAALACLLAHPLARGAAIGRERPLYAPLLALLLNAAPCLKGVTPPGAGAVMHLIAALAQPSVLLRDGAGAPLLRSVLDALAATLTHQADANPALLGALLRHQALLRDLEQLRLPPAPPATPEQQQPAQEAAAAAASASKQLFGGLQLVGPDAPPFVADQAWLDAARAQWPLAELTAVAAAVAGVHGAWRESRPGACVYEEADFLRAQPLSGLLPPPRPHAARTYARTRGVTAWQARHAAGLALLADAAAVDAPRVRRLRVAMR
jgi:hypothetical protein